MNFFQSGFQRLIIKSLYTLNDFFLNSNQLSGDITAAMGALQTAGLQNATLFGNGCLTVSDPAVSTWLTGLDPDWDDGC